MKGELIMLHDWNAILRFDCGCNVLIDDYDRRCFYRLTECHPVTGCQHTYCTAGHRCGASGSDAKHSGECGPVPPERKPLLDSGPTAPVAPAPILRKPARKPEPVPAYDDAPVWDSLLAEPAGVRR